MATSSIFARVKIDDSKKVEAFIDALEASENKPKRKPSVLAISPITDIDEIRKFMTKRFPE
ncbi:MAG: hypothetical protein NC121_16820 [Blautia sp.]|nr:hypothetical protein [Blautia sp.]